MIVKGILHGLASKKNFTKEDADPKELKMGIEVEYEHTDNKEVAETIALDHLSEIQDYYTRLKAMETEAKKAGAETKVKKESFESLVKAYLL